MVDGKGNLVAHFGPETDSLLSWLFQGLKDVGGFSLHSTVSASS